MNYTYWIIINENTQYGYEILRNNKVIIRQDVSPNYENQTFSTQTTAEQMAKLTIEKMKLLKSSIITKDEEDELSSGIVTDARIQELATLS